MNNIEKYVLAVLIVVVLAEVVPGPVNALLGLILIGMLLTQSQSFADLIKQIGTLSTGGK